MKTYNIINGLQMRVFRGIGVDLARVVIVSIVCVLLSRNALGCWYLNLYDLPAHGPAEAVVGVSARPG